MFILGVGDGLGEGYGMLGQAGSGKLRVAVGTSKLGAKVAKRYVFLGFSSASDYSTEMNCEFCCPFLGKLVFNDPAN